MITSIPGCEKKKNILFSISIWPWLTNSLFTVTWCHLPIKVIITLSAACLLARLLPDWLWKHLWFEKKKFSRDMHHSQKHIILRHTLQTLWQHVFLLFTTSPIIFYFFPFLLLSLSLWIYLLCPALPFIPLAGDGRAIKSLVPGLLYSKGCGHRQVWVGVV